MMEILKFGSRLSFTLAHRIRVGKTYRPMKCALSSYGGSGKSGKYKEFKDDDSTEILDVFEERIKLAETVADHIEDRTLDDGELEQVDSLGVEEVVDLIKNNRGKDVVVLKIPPELKYVDYLIITTCKSRRHIQGLGEIIRKHAKVRLNDMRKVPKLEGSESEWIALDFGNMCVHVMDRKLRESYDLESLWGVGAKYDTLLHQRDEGILSLLKQHSISSIGTNQEEPSDKPINLKAESI
ncbi:DUF143 [Nesidiocoris tenuis]|uniref:DUF143 n=1 Tax=Nesidiocoris tenuis TaxID=355587 RepID=A0ABN7AAR5_9HEMI|nr:DUF143 [Nesidiocoris tenuis]